MECFHLPHCHARTYPWTCPSVRPALLPSIPLFMALRVKAKVKVGTRVSNFRFQRQLHRLLGGICSVGFSVSGSFGFFGQGVQTLSTKQTVVNFWWRKYFFPFRLFSLQEAHLARTSVDFYSILLSNANGCSCTSPSAAHFNPPTLAAAAAAILDLARYWQSEQPGDKVTTGQSFPLGGQSGFRRKFSRETSN